MKWSEMYCTEGASDWVLANSILSLSQIHLYVPYGCCLISDQPLSFSVIFIMHNLYALSHHPKEWFLEHFHVLTLFIANIIIDVNTSFDFQKYKIVVLLW